MKRANRTTGEPVARPTRERLVRWSVEAGRRAIDAAGGGTTERALREARWRRRCREGDALARLSNAATAAFTSVTASPTMALRYTASAIAHQAAGTPPPPMGANTCAIATAAEHTAVDEVGGAQAVRALMAIRIGEGAETLIDKLTRLARDYNDQYPELGGEIDEVEEQLDRLAAIAPATWTAMEADPTWTQVAWTTRGEGAGTETAERMETLARTADRCPAQRPYPLDAQVRERLRRWASAWPLDETEAPLSALARLAAAGSAPPCGPTEWAAAWRCHQILAMDHKEDGERSAGPDTRPTETKEREREGWKNAARAIARNPGGAVREGARALAGQACAERASRAIETCLAPGFGAEAKDARARIRRALRAQAPGRHWTPTEPITLRLAEGAHGATRWLSHWGRQLLLAPVAPDALAQALGTCAQCAGWTPVVDIEDGAMHWRWGHVPARGRGVAQAHAVPAPWTAALTRARAP